MGWNTAAGHTAVEPLSSLYATCHSRDSSSGSLEPYDERLLRDSDHRSLCDGADRDGGPPPYSPQPPTGNRRRRGRGAPLPRRRSQQRAPHHYGLDGGGDLPFGDDPPRPDRGTPPRHNPNRRQDRRRRRQGGQPGGAGGSPPEPTLRAVLHAIGLILRSRGLRLGRLAGRNGRALARRCLAALGAAALVAVLLAAAVARGFFAEVVPLCSPPDGAAAGGGGGGGGRPPPLIEYYVHGRGNGHYARSVAIIENLNNAGVDVRMFIGRATMWRAVNEANTSSGEGKGKGKKQSRHVNPGHTGPDGGKSPSGRRGITSAISVTSVVPTMSFFTALSHTVERITGDCEVARQTGRYPDLVVSDGDMPGMLRARLGSIPSVGISHGQSFAVSVKPDWVRADKKLNKAWDYQRLVNSFSTFFTDWQIGTGFVNMETQRETGVIAMSPLRPEVVAMAKERRRRKQLQGQSLTNGSAFLTPTQQTTISSLLLGDTDDTPAGMRRKLVICYFRDKNGDVLLNVLLRSGFDVLLFERGYHKGLMNIKGVEKFGHKWIVRRDDKGKEFDGPEVSRDDYWKAMLARTHNKALGEEFSEEVPKDATGGGRRTVQDAGKAGAADGHHTEGRRLTAEDENEGDGHSRNVLGESVAPPRIIRVTDMSLFVPLMSIADGVASSAGSQLLSECIYSDIPVFSLFRENDSEQMLNIQMYRRMRGEGTKSGNAGHSSASVPHVKGPSASSNIVVHGVSVEKFTSAFSFITEGSESGTDAEENTRAQLRGASVRSSYNRDSGTYARGVGSVKLLTKEEELLLLRSPGAKSVYSEFNKFIDAVTDSAISQSYYKDLFEGGGRNQKEKVDLTGKAESEETTVNPFQGMPEAAAVILEILKQAVNDS